MARRQVISCPFQDEQGNVLANGQVVFEASGDAVVTGTGELCSGIKGSLLLDSNGQVITSPAQYMWPTDQMNPSNITYTVWVYAANGQLAWGPNYGLTVPSGVGSFNICTWVPNQIGSGSGAAAGSLTLQVNGTNNADQQLLNLVNGSNVTITDEGNGSVSIAATAGVNPAKLQFAVPPQAASGNTGAWPVSPSGSPQITVTSGGTSTESTPWVAPTATVPGYISSSTASTNPGITWIGNSASAGSLFLAAYSDFFIQAMLFVASNVRYWIGLTDDQNLSQGFMQFANPARHIVGFRYDPSVPDTHWQAYCSLDATHFTAVDTGVTPDLTGAPHNYEIKTAQGVPGTVLFFIDGTQVASIATANVPSSTQALGFCVYSDSTNAASSGHVGASLFTATLF